MKGSSALVASVLAASTIVLSSSSADRVAIFNSRSDESSSVVNAEERGDGNARSLYAKEKFSPRFDGLRFIETLVTAHR